MSQKFKTGDIVRLKSGGPKMTVANTKTSRDIHNPIINVYCAYWDENDQTFRNTVFIEHMIELVPEKD